MDSFTTLFAALDQTTKTSLKTQALTDYFKTAAASDKLWVIALFSGRRPKRGVTTTQLRAWAAERAGIAPWLFEECYPIVGDLAETIALVLPPHTGTSDKSLSDWLTDLSTLKSLSDADRRSFVETAWDSLDTDTCMIFNKLITGGFRIGISQKLMTRALANATGQDPADLAHRLMGDWSPHTTSYAALIEADDPASALSRPYPFYLAHGLDGEPGALGPRHAWHADWKWDGIRGQIILRDDHLFVWSRGEELMTDRFPEFEQLRDFLPSGTVLDGEILVWGDGKPEPFAALQPRINRKTVSKKLLHSAPVALYAYDLLEWQGTDLRSFPFSERRAILQAALAGLPPNAPVHLSPEITAPSWTALAEIRDTARANHAEGLMLKRKDSPYLAGRKRGDWWKWKLDPLTIDAVMIYAQSCHGRRATLFTDYTFAVWNGNDLVPFTKAYSGLTDAEFREITAWVRKNTAQRFGPVRQVPGELVFEIAFEGIQSSTRHKSGVALRFPRMLRWRKDKPAQQANTLDDLKDMLKLYG
jgi:DNA ligase-1